MKPEKLTPRQWATYNLIKDASSRGEKVSIEEIVANYHESAHKGGYSLSTGVGSHDICGGVWQDVTKINASTEVEKIIIIDNFTYRLATEEEAQEYYAEMRDKALRALVRANAIKRKIKADGQGKLISYQGVAIDEDSKARPFVESFVEGDRGNA